MSTVTTAERLTVVRGMSMKQLETTLHYLRNTKPSTNDAIVIKKLHEFETELQTEIDKRLASGKLEGSGEPCPENVCANCEIAHTCDKRNKKDITL